MTKHAGYKQDLFDLYFIVESKEIYIHTHKPSVNNPLLTYVNSHAKHYVHNIKYHLICVNCNELYPIMLYTM